MEKKKISKEKALARINECISQGNDLLPNYSDEAFGGWEDFCRNSLEQIFDKSVAQKFSGMIPFNVSLNGERFGSHKEDIPALLAFLENYRKNIVDFWLDEKPVARRMSARPPMKVNAKQQSAIEIILAMFLAGTLGFMLNEAGKQEDLLQKCNISRKDAKRRLDEFSEYQAELERIRYTTLWPQIVEVLHLYVFGFMKASAFFSASVLENALKEVLGCSGTFQELISRAAEKKIISPNEAAYMNGVRYDRNDVGHELKEISEKDVLTIINITIRVIGNLVSQNKPKQTQT